jgi:hypothetical protein
VARVEIVVRGRIDSEWSDWLGGLAISHTEQDETILTGAIVDQSALYGLLTKLRDLGVPLLAVRSEGTEGWESDATDRGSWPGLEASKGQQY